MISQLHKSRGGGTKYFSKAGIRKAVEDMYSREIQRMKDGNRVWVPGLNSYTVIHGPDLTFAQSHYTVS